MKAVEKGTEKAKAKDMARVKAKDMTKTVAITTIQEKMMEIQKGVPVNLVRTAPGKMETAIKVVLLPAKALVALAQAAHGAIGLARKWLSRYV